MNSFKVIAIGNLAANPELFASGDKFYARFCLIGNDYAGRDEEGNAKEITTSLYFVAFNGLGEAIARNARKGDQLILEAHIQANNWTDDQQKRHFDQSYIVDGFKFGAPGRLSRDELAQQQGSKD